MLLTKNRKLALNKFETFGVSLTPGSKKVCADSCPACRFSCFGDHGFYAMGNTKIAQCEKTTLFLSDYKKFEKMLIAEIIYLDSVYKQLAIRLQITSGSLELYALAEKLAGELPAVQFYDYCRNLKLWKRYLAGDMPRNYNLTLSASAKNAPAILKKYYGKFPDVRLAVVFAIKDANGEWIFPETFHGYKVLDGDLTDERFLDAVNFPDCPIVGLRPKSGMSKEALRLYPDYTVTPENYKP